MSDSCDICIIGAGPAGIAAAIQARRMGFKVTVFEVGRIGGLLRNANLVENYPGFPNGVSGNRLADLFEQQLLKHCRSIVFEEVKDVSWSGDLFRVRTESRQLNCRFVMIASGTEALEVEILKQNLRPGRDFYTEVADLEDRENCNTAIIGSGDAALDYALNLGKRNTVSVFSRSQGFKGLPLLIERCGESDRVSLFTGHELLGCRNTGDEIELDFRVESGIQKFKFDFAVTAIGRKPAISFLDETVIDNLSSLKSKGCVYFIGDVKNGLKRQVSISVGDAVAAVMDCYLKTKDI